MANITIEEIVSDSIDGTGAFDEIMNAVEIRLEREFNKGRIRGEDYANVYLGSIQSAMAQAIQFVLQKQQSGKVADKTDAEIALLSQKKLTEEAQILDTVNSNPVAGIVGQQKTLYQRQADGFLRDAEQKAVKAFTDIWTIAKSTDPDSLATALPLNADQSSMDVLLAKLSTAAGLATQEDLGTPSSEFTNKTITNAVDSGAADIVITSVNHGLVTGDAVSITGVGGMVEINDKNFIITYIDEDSFSLDNTDAIVGTTYTSGGNAQKL